MNERGYFGVGIFHPKFEVNQGTLWRSAFAFGADFIFTVGRRFTHQASDTPKSWMSVPMYHYLDMDDLVAHLPHACPLVGVELGEKSRPLDRFCHPTRCCYLLGAEDHGLPPAVVDRCHHLVEVPGLRTCLNVATAGSLVMYDRKIQKAGTKTARRESA